MDLLSSSIKNAIQKNPLQTVVRDDHETVGRLFNTIPIFSNPRSVSTPRSFDGRTIWSSLLSPVKDQGLCGSCWAFASTGALASRFNIQSNNSLNIDLSETNVILCDFKGVESINHPERGADRYTALGLNRDSIIGTACTGNTLYDVYKYLYEIGTCTSKCISYTSLDTISINTSSLSTITSPIFIPTCSFISGPIGDMCSDFSIDYETGTEFGTPKQLYRALAFYTLPSDQEHIKKDIFLYGPIASAIKVYADFYTFDTQSIYTYDGTSPRVGGHAVEIVGWGTLDNKDYWLIKNSWGTQWGLGGYFMIARGSNECGIEENCIGCFPDYFYNLNYVFPLKGFPHMPASISKTRMDISTDLSTTGGGIDPTVGYTRRVLNTMQWLDLSAPKNIHPVDINTFVAGYIKLKESGLNSNNGIEKSYTWLYITILACFLFIVLLIFQYYHKTIQTKYK